MHVPSAQSLSWVQDSPSARPVVTGPPSDAGGVPPSGVAAGTRASCEPFGFVTHCPLRQSWPAAQSAVVSQPGTQQFSRQTSPKPQALFWVHEVAHTEPPPLFTLLAQPAASSEVM